MCVIILYMSDPVIRTAPAADTNEMLNGDTGMRVRRLAVLKIVGAALAVSCVGLMGCENTQGTSADPDLTRESLTYKNNDDPQNTGAGAGAVGKPPDGPTTNMGGESPSQTLVKGTGAVSEGDKLAADTASNSAPH